MTKNDLTFVQLKGLSAYTESLERNFHDVCRVTFSNRDSSGNVQVVVSSLFYGDLLQSTRWVLRLSGEVLTNDGYGEYVRRLYSAA